MDVSVIIPCDRDRGYLRQAVASAECQDFSGTWEVIVQQARATVGKNMNDGFKRAKGQWIKKLDEDDLLPPDSLQSLFDFATSSSLDWVYADAEYFNDFPETNEWYAHRILKKWFTLSDLMRRNYIHGGALLYHRSTFEITGGWDEDLFTAEEYDWHLLLTAKRFERGYLPKVVYWQRMHEDSKYNYFVKEYPVERKAQRDMIVGRYEGYVSALHLNQDEPGHLQPG